jgi:plasmid replication initiation protein
MEKQKPDLKSIVAKDNQMIEQIARFKLSELRLIAYCLAHYDSRVPENRTFTATVEDLKSIFPITPKAAYDVVRQAMLGINQRPLEITEGQDIMFWNWFSGFVYTKGTGTFKFKLNPDALPYLLGLKKNFTRYRLEDVYQFKAASTWKLYELLKRWIEVRKWSVELEELKLLLGIAGKYPRWNSLNQWVITPATKEINEVSDISVSWEKIKHGRSVVGLAFKIHPKKEENEETIDVQTDRERLHAELIRIGINTKTAKDYASAIDFAGKTSLILGKLPGIVKRAKGKGPLQKYVLGAIQQEINQRSLFEDPHTNPSPNPDHAESLACWQAKHRAGEVCKVRQRYDGKTQPHRIKCRICIGKVPLELDEQNDR